MKTTTRMVIVDPNPGDYLSLGTPHAGGDVQFHLLPCGQDALRMAEHITGAMWLINTRLPDMRGVDLYRVLRPRLSGSPVTMVADEYSVEEELQVMELGTVTYVPKPIDTLAITEIADAVA